MSQLTILGLCGMGLIAVCAVAGELMARLESIGWPYPRATVLLLVFAALAAAGAA